MSGHSKWSTIKHKKAVTDAKRGAAFTKVAKKIYIAVKDGGSGDPDKNPSLRSALDEARTVNMPNANIKRAVDRGLGLAGGGEVEVSYEGYGLGGVGVEVRVVTDNKNRSGAEVKNIFERYGGSLGGPGSVAYLRKLDPLPQIEIGGGDRKRVEEMIEKLEEMDEVVDVWTNLKL